MANVTERKKKEEKSKQNSQSCRFPYFVNSLSLKFQSDKLCESRCQLHIFLNRVSDISRSTFDALQSRI